MIKEFLNNSMNLIEIYGSIFVQHPIFSSIVLVWWVGVCLNIFLMTPLLKSIFWFVPERFHPKVKEAKE